MSLTASIVRDGVEYEIAFTKPDRVRVHPGLDVEIDATPRQKLRARQEAARIEADLDRLLRRPAYDVEADEDGWKVPRGSNRHVRLVLANYGAEIALDYFDFDEEIEAIERDLGGAMTTPPLHQSRRRERAARLGPVPEAASAGTGPQSPKENRGRVISVGVESHSSAGVRLRQRPL